jgi:hypothetical protein
MRHHRASGSLNSLKGYSSFQGNCDGSISVLSPRFASLLGKLVPVAVFAGFLVQNPANAIP